MKSVPSEPSLGKLPSRRRVPAAPQLKTGNIGIVNTSTLAILPATPNGGNFAILPASEKH